MYSVAVTIQFSKEAVTVNESEGTVTLTLVKDGQTAMDFELEITLTPGSAGKLRILYTSLRYRHRIVGTVLALYVYTSSFQSYDIIYM